MDNFTYLWKISKIVKQFYHSSLIFSYKCLHVVKKYIPTNSYSWIFKTNVERCRRLTTTTKTLPQNFIMVSRRQKETHKKCFFWNKSFKHAKRMILQSSNKNKTVIDRRSHLMISPTKLPFLWCEWQLLLNN